MNEKQYQYLVGIAIIILLVLVVYVSGRVSELEATVFGTGEAPGAALDEGDLLGYTYGAYDPNYYYGYAPYYNNDYTADVYNSYYGSDPYSSDYSADPYDAGYSY